MRQVTAKITHSNGTKITIGNQTQTFAYNIGATWDARDIRCNNAIMFTGWRNLGPRLEQKLIKVLTKLQYSQK